MILRHLLPMAGMFVLQGLVLLPVRLNSGIYLLLQVGYFLSAGLRFKLPLVKFIVLSISLSLDLTLLFDSPLFRKRVSEIVRLRKEFFVTL